MLSSIPDLINGCFESTGAIAVFLNVLRILKDKEIRGVHWFPTLFFTSWGFWNIYYYRHLDQPISWYGGMALVFTNTIWLVLVFWYSRRNENDHY